MTKRPVTIVDYGIGNIFSVSRAVEHFGAEPRLSGDPKALLAAERLILPGVGAFANGMQGLRERGLVEPIRQYAATGKPLLGICLGMQMLLTVSEEFGTHEGLGIIPGKVAAVSGKTHEGGALKIPHIGWSPLVRPDARPTWDDTILAKLAPESTAYFVHSFTAVPEREDDRLADAWHGTCRISAAIQRGNVSGCQFHPEKSGVNGLAILGNFLEHA